MPTAGCGVIVSKVIPVSRASWLSSSSTSGMSVWPGIAFARRYTSATSIFGADRAAATCWLYASIFSWTSWA